MTQDVKEYAEQRILESGIRRVPGHYPDFESREHVDQWIQMASYVSEKRKAEDMTSVDLDEYRSKLACLRRNKENVSLELLTTKYRKSYMQLKEELKAMTEQIVREIVCFNLFVERSGCEETFDAVNCAIRESDLLAEISHAVYRKQDAGLVIRYAMQLREIVHQTVKKQKGGKTG